MNRAPTDRLTAVSLVLLTLLAVSACSSGPAVQVDGPALIYFYEDG